MFASFLVYGGGFWLILAAIVAVGIWRAQTLDADDPAGYSDADLQAQLHLVGDEAEAVIFEWPGGTRRNDHALDAEFQRGPWTPRDAA